MRKFKIFTISNLWSTTKLTEAVEKELLNLTTQGYEIISVSFGVNMWKIPTAFITVTKETLI